MNKNIFRCEGEEREEVLKTLHHYNQAINALYWLAGGCEDAESCELFEECAFAIEENAERWIGVHLDLNELEKVLRGEME